MILCSASMGDDPRTQVDYVHDNSRDNIGLVPAYDAIYRLFPQRKIIGYIHSDVTIHESYWRERVAAEFSDPKVAVVGMGGATGIGVRDIYKKRYEISQLQRIDYYSNQRDWQVHGKHERGSRDVATLDGFFVAVRRAFLDQIGGWSWFPFTFHNYDNALCLQAHRHGWKVRMVGVDCTHHGGGGSTSPAYAKWCEARGTTMEREHQEPHVWMYEHFRDLLPLRV